MRSLLRTLKDNKHLFSDVVPKEFLSKPHKHAGFSEELIRFFQAHPDLEFSPEDMVDPHKCARLVERVHKEGGLAWSYGGYLEDRSVILQGSYLRELENWMHLGIDINLPIGTAVLAAADGVVYKVDSDYPEEGGWGTYVILKHSMDGVIFYSIYGHLHKKALVKPGDKVLGGQVIGSVGDQSENGFWFPHLHFQMISEPEMKSKENPFTLDGYGSKKDLAYLKENYPDPLIVLPMARAAE